MLNKCFKALILPTFFSAIILITSEGVGAATYFYKNGESFILYSLTKALNTVIPFVFVYFVVQSSVLCKRAVKSFFAMLCFGLYFVITQSGAQKDYNFIFALILSLVAVLLYNQTDVYISSAVLLIFSALSALLTGYISEYIYSFEMFVADKVSGSSIISSVLFGVCNTLFSVFDIGSFQDMFLYKSFGGAELIDGAIATGVADMFSQGYEGKFLSVYITGGYLFICGLFGMGISLAKLEKGDKKRTVSLLSVATLISGNPVLMLIILILSSPYMLISAIVISALSYAAANILDIRTGYLFSGGIFESLSFINKPVYFILTTLVIGCIGYFSAKYNAVKFGLSSSTETYIPPKLRQFVEAIGGVENIIKINDDSIEVRNIKRVNELELDFELKDNTLVFDDTTKLKELNEYIK